MVGPAVIGGGDSGGGAQQPSGGSGARSSDFASRMERMNALEANNPQGFGGAPQAPSQRPRPTRDEDPSVSGREALDGSQAEPIEEEFADDELATVEEEPVEGEYTDPNEVAKQEFLTKLAEHLERGQLPLDQLGEMVIEKTLPNGRKVEISLNEMDRGYMRQNDYTRKLQETGQIKARADNIVRLEQARNQQWQNEEIMIRDLYTMGLGEAFDRAVMRHAKATVEFRRLPAHEQQRIQGEQREQARQRAYEQKIAQLEQKLQRPNVEMQQAEVTQHFQRQLNQLLPKAFKEFGLTAYPTANAKFIENLQVLYEHQGNTGECSADLVRRACEATKLELDDMAWRAGQVPRQRPQTGLPPRRLSGQAGPAVVSANGNGHRKRPSEFGKKFATSGM